MKKEDQTELNKKLSNLYDKAHKRGFKAGLTVGAVLSTIIFLIILNTY
jgi:hypothetical protein